MQTGRGLSRPSHGAGRTKASSQYQGITARNTEWPGCGRSQEGASPKFREELAEVGQGEPMKARVESGVGVNVL